MGLTTDITEAIQEAFDFDLADAVNTVSITYTTTTYNTTTGVVTEAGTSVASRAVVQPVDKSMIDGEVVQIADTSFLILQAELSITPKVGDTITVNLIPYSINTVLQDPASVTWTMIGRAT